MIRHGEAGVRSDWRGADDTRPLTAAGRGQADQMVTLLRTLVVGSIVSSPYRRCVQTVFPAAAALSLKVELDPRLAPGPVGPALSRARDLQRQQVDAVLCSHGELIAPLVERIAGEDGLDLGVSPQFEKGSVWIFYGSDKVFVTATYLAASTPCSLVSPSPGTNNLFAT